MDTSEEVYPTVEDGLRAARMRRRPAGIYAAARRGKAPSTTPPTDERLKDFKGSSLYGSRYDEPHFEQGRR